MSVEETLSVMWLSSEVWVHLSVESESDFAPVSYCFQFSESESGYIRGGDDLLATLSDGGILKHIHHGLADLMCFALAWLQSI